MRNLVRYSVLSASLLASACYSSAGDVETNGLAAASVIRYGTSFGMCAGYCREDLQIDGGQIKLTRSSWDPRQPTRVEELSISPDAWRKLQATLNGVAIADMDSVYGCPDCADGGAEWVEIENGSSKKRVTFEFSKSPARLRAAVTELRALRQRFPPR
ncbi:MAG: hypothetical protein ACRERX_22590 [Pseudomonas sp.]